MNVLAQIYCLGRYGERYCPRRLVLHMLAFSHHEYDLLSRFVYRSCERACCARRDRVVAEDLCLETCLRVDFFGAKTRVHGTWDWFKSVFGKHSVRRKAINSIDERVNKEDKARANTRIKHCPRAVNVRHSIDKVTHTHSPYVQNCSPPRNALLRMSHICTYFASKDGCDEYQPSHLNQISHALISVFNLAQDTPSTSDISSYAAPKT